MDVVKNFVQSDLEDEETQEQHKLIETLFAENK